MSFKQNRLRTDHPTDGRTEKPSYRDGWTHLKNERERNLGLLNLFLSNLFLQVSNLFQRDEMDEITQELIPVMKKEHPRRPPSNENLYDYFLSRFLVETERLHLQLALRPFQLALRPRAGPQTLLAGLQTPLVSPQSLLTGPQPLWLFLRPLCPLTRQFFTPHPPPT